MEISYLGHASFKIKGKPGFNAGELVTVVTDPFSPETVGLPFPKIEADIVCVSHQHDDHNYLQGIVKQPFVVASPGEYEVKGLSLFVYPSYHDNEGGKQRGANNITVLEVEECRICHLGDLGTILTQKELEQIGSVDILLIPVGGKYTLDAEGAVEVISLIQPGVVIPMHYQLAGGESPLQKELAPVTEFVKEIGAVESLPKLTITREKIPEETRAVILDRKS